VPLANQLFISYLPFVKKTLFRIKSFWQYLVLCLVFYDGVAQSASVQMGARANGMAYASSCLSDVWALTNNIGGLAKVDKPSAAFSYHAIPSASFFDRMAAVICVPIRNGAAGLSIFRFGDDLYSEQMASLGFAHTFGLASLGIKINYLQYNAEAMGTHKALTCSFGGLAELTPKLFLGAHIININQPVINTITGERIPTRLIAGIAFKPSTKMSMAAEIEKDLEYNPIVKAGFEYEVFKKITFRTGFNLNPKVAFFGMGFKPRKFSLDYALQLNDAFGLSHQATVTYELKGK
jgi:hypothetical protein